MKSVQVIMGSASDLETMKYCLTKLTELSVEFDVSIVSAHRTPEKLYEFAKQSKYNPVKVIIAAAGGAAHLPGMVASLSERPVIGVPIKSSVLNGVDSLLSICQMPAGVPVATMAIGKAGAINAAIFAAQIIGSDVTAHFSNQWKSVISTKIVYDSNSWISKNVE